jgi:hypothetical protein
MLVHAPITDHAANRGVRFEGAGMPVVARVETKLEITLALTSAATRATMLAATLETAAVTILAVATRNSRLAREQINQRGK